MSTSKGVETGKATNEKTPGTTEQLKSEAANNNDLTD